MNAINHRSILTIGVTVLLFVLSCRVATHGAPVEHRPDPVSVIEIIAIDWTTSTLVNQNAERLMRHSQAVHAFVRRQTTLDSIQLMIADLRLLRREPQFDVRTAAILRHDGNQTDTLSFGYGDMMLNGAAVVFDTALARCIMRELPVQYGRQMEEWFAANP